MSRQNEKMRERLASLGFAMALEHIPNHSQITSNHLDEVESIAGAYAEDNRRFQESSSTHTAGRSAHNSRNGHIGTPFTSSDRPFKRQRVDSPLPDDMQVDLPSSRDAMPPPPKPVSRIRSVRGLIPTLRKKFSNTRRSTKGHQNSDVQMHDQRHWRDAGSSRDDNVTSRLQHDGRSETPYMTGALPLGAGSQRHHTGVSEFTFRASSPVKMDVEQGNHKPVQLPKGPSCLNFMGGLDNGFELGLRDPRQNASGSHSIDHTLGLSVTAPRSQRQTQEIDSQQRWGLGHAFPQQSPNGLLKLASQESTSPNDHFSRAQYDQFVDNASPLPIHQPVRQIESVVSPFFGSHHFEGPTVPQFRITETKTSSTRSGAYRSQGRPTSQQISANCCEPRSSNSLSFIDSPLDSNNEPIIHQGHHKSSQHKSNQSHKAYDTYSYGFAQRPDTKRPPYIQDSAYGSSMHDTPRIPHRQEPRSVLPFSSTRRASTSRVRQLPSAMPPVVSSHSPIRNQTHWETLQRAGVRSSRRTYNNIRGNTINAKRTYSPLRVERRSVVR